MVDDVIATIRERWAIIKRSDLGASPPYPYETLAGRYPSDQVLALMARLADADILEYGVSLRTAWVAEYDPQIEDRIRAFKAGRDHETYGEVADTIEQAERVTRDRLAGGELERRRKDIMDQVRAESAPEMTS